MFKVFTKLNSTVLTTIRYLYFPIGLSYVLLSYIIYFMNLTIEIFFIPFQNSWSGSSKAGVISIRTICSAPGFLARTGTVPRTINIVVIGRASYLVTSAGCGGRGQLQGRIDQHLVDLYDVECPRAPHLDRYCSSHHRHCCHCLSIGALYNQLIHC